LNVARAIYRALKLDAHINSTLLLQIVEGLVQSHLTHRERFNLIVQSIEKSLTVRTNLRKIASRLDEEFYNAFNEIIWECLSQENITDSRKIIKILQAIEECVDVHTEILKDPKFE